MATRKDKTVQKGGRPTDLTEKLSLEIRKLVLEGANYTEIQTILGISDSLWDRWTWLDYKDFRKNLNSWKREMFLKKAEKVSNQIMELKHTDQNGFVKAGLLSLKQKEAEFLRETLGKDDGYSKRSELSGPNGKDLIPSKEKKTEAQDALGDYLKPQKNETAKHNKRK